jgi:hypothetical protein
MKQTILWVYSGLFRIAGLLLAVMSAIVSVVIAIGIVKQGSILVEGQPDKSLTSISIAIGTPLMGVLLGLGLFYFVPKVRRSSEQK